MLSFQLGLQFSDALFQWRNQFLNLVDRITRRDVLGTVPVEGCDFDEKDPLHDSMNIGFGQLPDEIRMAARILHSGMAEDLEPLALNVIVGAAV